MSDRQGVIRISGDFGEFLITEQMMVEAGGEAMSFLESAILEQAAARGLAICVETDRESGGLRVRWKPDSIATRPNEMTRL